MEMAELSSSNSAVSCDRGQELEAAERPVPTVIAAPEPRRPPGADRGPHRVPAKAVFVLIVVLEVLVNYDSGALPAMLDLISDVFRMGKFEQGLLGGLPYVGLVIASPITGRFLIKGQKISAKIFLFVTLLMNVGCCILMAAAHSRPHVFLSRFGCGLTQAAFVIYAPVWIDEFAPRDSVTTWMAVLQASIAIGVMVGYGGGAVFQGPENWRVAFIIQVVSLATFVIVFGALDRSWIDLPTRGRRAGTIAQHRMESVSVPMSTFVSSASFYGGLPTRPARSESTCSKIKGLAANRVFVSVVLALCGLFFVVTGIQFWATSHLNNLYSLSHVTVSHDEVGDYNCPQAVGSYSRRWFNKFNGQLVFVKHPDDAIMYWSGNWRISGLDHAAEAELPLPRIAKEACSVDGTGERGAPDKADWPSGWKVEAGKDRSLTFICFAFVAATGPTLGVIVGGRIIDSLGGYYGHANMVRSLRMCAIFGALATFVGLLVSLVDLFWPTVIGLWIVLFFGGCILPPATGMLISVVDPETRPFASAVSMVFYNVFGYALGSILPGIVMGWLKRKAAAEESRDVDIRWVEVWGMRLILWWSVLGFIGMLSAWQFAKGNTQAARGMSTLRSERGTRY